MLERRFSLLLPPPIASGRFAVVLPSLSLLALSIRPALLSSVSASVAQFICLQGQSPSDAFILRSFVQFLLCSVHLSLVAVFFPIKIHSSVVRLHYISTKWYGQNGIRIKCHSTKWYGQNGIRIKCHSTKWYVPNNIRINCHSKKLYGQNGI